MTGQPNAPTMKPSASGVKVRMYNPGGLGDCFLLCLRASDGTPRYVLIDSGVITGTENSAENMTQIAADIAAATGNHLHILVVTHEHYDHLSGFVFETAKTAWSQIEVDQIWVAWTEDRNDTLAQEVQRNRSIGKKTLQKILDKMDGAKSEKIKSVAEFNPDLGAAAGFSGIIDLLDEIWPKVSKIKYCYPNEPPISVPGAGDVAIYVLGPPRTTQLLRSDPSKRRQETYQEEGDKKPHNKMTALYGALLEMEDRDLDSDDRSLMELSRPFDLSYRIRFDQAEADQAFGPFFARHYGSSKRGDDEHGPQWRRIDDDWLDSGGQLALKLDNATNNSSLVLAFELRRTKKVLLFPGDAQVGSWLSWPALSWNSSNGADQKKITGEDLMRRTVLYKVGHHGSHNATLRERGLELMTSPDLVAIIPVNEQQAREKKSWHMPLKSLYCRLREKTKGRILRTDATGFPVRPGDLNISDDEWAAFRRNVIISTEDGDGGSPSMGEQGPRDYQCLDDEEYPKGSSGTLWFDYIVLDEDGPST